MPPDPPDVTRDGTSPLDVGVPLDVTLQLAVHDAVRRDLVRMVTLLGGTAQLPPPRIAALKTHWLLVAELIRAHEAVEDELLWPAATGLSHEVAAAVEQARSKQAAMDVALEQASRAVDGFAGGKDRAVVAAAVVRAARLVDLYYAAEEQRIFPLLQGRLPVEVWQELTEAVARPDVPYGRDVLLPWLLQGAPSRRVAALVDGLGPYERTRLSESWAPAYRERVAVLWGTEVYPDQA